MEQFMSQAQNAGLYAVDSDNISSLSQEYDEALRQSDILLEKVDPETKPYESKYEARKILDQICNKLEATRTVASLDKKSTIIENMDWRLAAARTRIGIISWECDEPHNAQTELELAASYYCPSYVEFVNEMTGGELENDTTPKEASDVSVADEIEASLPATIIKPRSTSLGISPNEILADAIKCLNMMGILWAGRGRVKRSFNYLLAAKLSFENLTPEQLTSLSTLKQKDLDDIYTHTLFYLAQAYGHIGNAMKSSFYCRSTLQRQLDTGLTSTKLALEWVKNSASLGEYYMSKQHYRIASICLASTENILQTKVIASLPTGTSLPSDVVDISGDLHQRWARLDVKVLRRAYDRMMSKRTAEEMDLDWQEEDEDTTASVGAESLELASLSVRVDSIADVGAELGHPSSGTSVEVSETVNSLSSMSLQDNSKGDISSSAAAVVGAPVASIAQTEGEIACRRQFFRGVSVEELPYLLPGEITTFEAARAVYLRASSRIEQAKKVFVIDGCVTDHVNLLAEHSKLYHYLAFFEDDTKRKLAMESRRVDMLAPLLDALNKAAFEGLHKEISYEVGEANLTLLDIKLDKLRGRTGGEVDIRSLKKVEITKCNEYCRAGIAMFTHFAHLYARAEDRQIYAKSNAPFGSMGLDELIAAACLNPDNGLIMEDEIRPFLNCHFLTCRLLSKVITVPNSAPIQRSQWLVAALQRYTWLSGFARTLCTQKHIDVLDVFGQELQVCDDMMSLLPSKIDRMHHLGEGGLSL